MLTLWSTFGERNRKDNGEYDEEKGERHTKIRSEFWRPDSLADARVVLHV
jgi:hypothetical protein